MGDKMEEYNKLLKEYVGEYTEKEKALGFELLNPSDLVLERKLGSGTSAEVYIGKLKGEEVAVKVLRDNIEAKLWEDFKKELKVMSIVKGPRIVGFFGVCIRPIFCIAMEYCSMGTLKDVLSLPDVLWDWERTFDVLGQTIQAVQVLHDYEPQIVHRDLKTLNLLVDKDWHVKVCDFGLSRQTSEEGGDGNDVQINTPTTLYKLRGTYGYSAPELYNREKCTTKADIFSLGVILWEILYRALKGEYVRPYSDQKQMIADYQILIAVAKKGLRPTIPDHCPESFKMMLRSCWVDDPAGRPDCGFLLASLRTIKDKEYKPNKQDWDKLLPIPQSTNEQAGGEKEAPKKPKKKKEKKEGDEGKKKKKGDGEKKKKKEGDGKSKGSKVKKGNGEEGKKKKKKKTEGEGGKKKEDGEKKKKKKKSSE